MTTTDVPEAPVTRKRKLSPEHIAKMQAGRKKKAEAQPAAADDKDARIAELEAKLASILPSPAKLAALPTRECYVEFVADKRGEQGEFIGERLDSADDPRWDFLERYDRPIHGSLVVNALSRNERGEVVSRRQIHGAQWRKAEIAREFMRKFAEHNGDVSKVIKA